MPRKKTLLSDQYPYHITTRSNHRTWFQLNMNEVWNIATQSIEVALKKYPVRIHAFVLMNNHYHLVLDTPDANIDKFMYEFNKNFSLKLRIKTKLINRMFGGRYKWSLIRQDQHYLHVLKYVYLNPVKAKIVHDPYTYPYSTIYPQIHQNKFPTHPSPFIDPFTQEFIAWINQSHTIEQNVSITKGLTKTNFNFSGSRQKRVAPIFNKPLSLKLNDNNKFLKKIA